jgi:pimeloyl-ACP methyl ester carboxylesterase
MVDSVHRLVIEGLKVAHLRLVIGSSLGCMHSFMWAEKYPDLTDGIVGLSCPPVEISGRNRITRRAAAEAIRHDPDWNNGNYDKNPTPLHLQCGGRIVHARECGAHPGNGADPRRRGPALWRARGTDRQRRRQ